jgi:uncharacterized protein YceK
MGITFSARCKITWFREERLLLNGPEFIQSAKVSFAKHMQIDRVILCCLLLFAASGCAAIGERMDHGAGRPYAGVRDEAHYMAHPSEADYPDIQFLSIFDMPFSFVVDTVCLPYDLAKTNGATTNVSNK